MSRVTETYPDKNGVVRNVEIKVAPRCEGSSKYKPQVLYKLKRHVSKLIVIIPVEENNQIQSIDQHTLCNEETDVIESEADEEINRFKCIEETDVKESETEEEINRFKLESSKSGPNN